MTATSLIPPFGPRATSKGSRGRRPPVATGSFGPIDFALQTSGSAANSASGALQVLDSSRLESAGAAATTWPGRVLTDLASFRPLQESMT